MRDVVIVSLVLFFGVMALTRPWIGVMLWTWLSIMNPHRYAWGFAVDAPLAAIAAGTTLIGLIYTRDRSSPFKGAATVLLVMLMLWMTLSWLVGLDPATDYEQWKKVMKIDFMIIVALMLLHTKEHILALVWVAAGSMALLGVKGGVYTLVGGGTGRVWGPPGSFIADNNEFALALIMTIPLLRFLQQQLTNKWGGWAMTGAMLLCAIAALGSYSRGALIAIAAMTLSFWWRGKNKLLIGIVLVAASFALIGFMPENWMGRMNSIVDYEQDQSAMGRISAWWNAWNIGLNRPFGVGFDAARPELFAQYSPYPNMIHAAHSIYFQILGNHGFVGLFLFLGIWLMTWRSAGWLRINAKDIPQARWCAELGAMCQVSLIGYLVGGAFLSLAYFDLPFDVMVAVVLAKKWVEARAWEREPVYQPGWKTIPGLSRPVPSA
ncbi:MAG: putative O-glycosylation ligase, exosortase A system-associated [Burkholderiales bacterium]